MGQLAYLRASPSFPNLSKGRMQQRDVFHTMNQSTPVTERTSSDESGLENLFQLFGVLHEIDRENQTKIEKDNVALS